MFWLVMSLVVVSGCRLHRYAQLSPYVGIGIWPWLSFVVCAWFFVCPLFEGDVGPVCCVKKGKGRHLGKK